MYEIELNSRCPLSSDCQSRLQEAVRRVLAAANVASAEVSLAIVDDPTIHQLNRRHLAHDYATDVLSFVLEEGPEHLEGEIIVSWDHARVLAAEVGWNAEDELLLYVIHGALHLIGFDDHHPEDRQRMREAEAAQLNFWGLATPRLSPVESDRQALSNSEPLPSDPPSPRGTADAQERS